MSRVALVLVLGLLASVLTVVVPAVTGLTQVATAATSNFTLTKTPSTTTLPYGGGSVTYTYTAKNNTSGYLYYANATDDKCRSISDPSGSGVALVGLPWWNSAYRLAPGATATFTCTQTLTQTTTNTATFSFGTGYNWLGQLTGVASNNASATVTMTNDVSNVCNQTTIWGNSSTGWRGTGTAYQYTVNSNGTATYTGKSLTLTGSSSDIAISPDGTKMYTINGAGTIREFDVATGNLLRTFTVTYRNAANTGNTTWYDGGANQNVINSLSFGPNGVLYVGGIHYTNYAGGAGDLYTVNVSAGAPTTQTATVLVAQTSVTQYGFAGDFITLPNGDLLALANSATGQGNLTKFVIYPLVNGKLGNPVDVGMPSVPSTVNIWGATYSNGSLWLAGSDGSWYRVDTMPSTSGTSASTTYPVVKVSATQTTAFWGATGSQEVNAQCTSPSVDLQKSAGSVTGPDANGVYTATFTIKAVNTSTTQAGSYAPITDTQQFDSNMVVQSASWTGQATGSATGSGPYAITTTPTNIAAGATHTYTVSIKFTWNKQVLPSACAGPGTGLFNTASLPSNSENSTRLTNNSACDAPPLIPWLNVSKTAGTTSGPDASGTYTVTYTIDVVNSGTGSTTFGALTDTPAFDPNLTVTGASWTSDKVTSDANGNPVTTVGGGPSSGTTTGTGPFTLAPANTPIAAGVDYKFNVTLSYKYTGTGTAAACGGSGTGLYNSASLPSSQENGGTTDNAACVAPPTKPASLNMTKTAGTVSGPDATGKYAVTYTVKAINTGGAGTYGALTDTPAFASNLAIDSFTSAKNGGSVTTLTPTSGVYTLAPAGTAIAANATDTYAITVTFHYTNATQATACAGAGTGLFNRVAVPSGQETSTTDNSACVAPPAPPVPTIALDKTGSTTSLSAPGSVTYTYKVTTTGTDPVKGVTLADDKCTVSQTHTGDTNGDGLLQPGETWTYTCTQTISSTTTNTATVTGTGNTTGTSVSATDTWTVTVTVTKAIHVRKVDSSGALTGGAAFAIYSVNPSIAGATPIASGITADTAGGATFTSVPLTAGQDYWLVETKAPTGKVLLASPIRFQVSSSGITLASGTSGATVTGADALTLTVTDPKTGILPRTGGPGAGLPLSTALIVAAALLLAWRGRRSGQRM